MNMKQQLIERCLRKEMPWKEAAGILVMHPKALSRLKRNYLKHGPIVLIGRKPGPKSYRPPNNKTDEDTENIIVRLGLTYPQEGSQPLADRLLADYGRKLDQTTVWRILKRKNVCYGQNYRRWKDDPKLYCLEVPGQELQLDACYPYGRSRNICSFDAIDDCSRFADGQCYDRETADNAMKFVDRLVLRSPFSIKRLRVDNRYGRRFKEYCLHTYGIEVVTNEPYAPEQNGKIERFHKTLKREFFYRYCAWTDPIELINLKYSLWLKQYNYHRHHRGLGMDGKTPAQKITLSFLQDTVNTIITHPQKVTGTLQQYTI